MEIILSNKSKIVSRTGTILTIKGKGILRSDPKDRPVGENRRGLPLKHNEK